MIYNSRVSEAVIRRLPMYYRHLGELSQEGVERISSQQLSERMDLTASQIRQDINCFGGFGHQGFGYRVESLRRHIGIILGLERNYRMIVVGAGNIGRAVAGFAAFSVDGFSIEALFDRNEKLIGSEVGGIRIRSVDEMELFAAETPVDIGVIAVPGPSAQEVADRMVKAGIRAIWNFAPVDLSLPAHVWVNDVHLLDSLWILTYRMNEEALFARIDAEKKGREGQKK